VLEFDNEFVGKEYNQWLG